MILSCLGITPCDQVPLMLIRKAIHSLLHNLGPNNKQQTPSSCPRGRLEKFGRSKNDERYLATVKLCSLSSIIVPFHWIVKVSWRHLIDSDSRSCSLGYGTGSTFKEKVCNCSAMLAKPIVSDNQVEVSTEQRGELKETKCNCILEKKNDIWHFIVGVNSGSKSTWCSVSLKPHNFAIIEIIKKPKCVFK